jgi:eukaryotic-like serine/threonine-protein kinase
MNPKDLISKFSTLEFVSESAETIPWFNEAVLEDEEEPAKIATPVSQRDTHVERPRRPPPVPTTPMPPQTRSPRAGTQLQDEGEIARGGMGSIRKLYDPELRRHIAMKVLEPSADPNASQRFIDEARITGRLDHANIVPVHDLVIDNRGTATYTMKLVAGQTLSELIAAQKTQRDLETILQSLIKVCDALSFAHSRGVIHRDLKPDNIMVGSHGQVYVMDWGCAQVIGDDLSLVEGRVDPDGMVIGTVAYMAPEQAQGLITKIDQRTDVFGVGAILYKVLTGSAPYPGPVMEALARAQRCDVSPPDERTGLAIKPPPHLSQIAMKAMARDPANRFPTVDAFAEELRAFLRGGNWFPLHKFAAGSVIVREGDRADAAYIITAGRCEVRKADPHDPKRTIVLRTLSAGDVFGETAIFADMPRSASVVALDEVSAVLVERAAIENLTRSSWLGLFVKALADRFLDVDAQLSKVRK